MAAMTAGITKAGTGIDGIVWNILGQTYVPKQLSENSFSWHATLPPGTGVPPHIHPTQDAANACKSRVPGSAFWS